jgi:hypothetical protein
MKLKKPITINDFKELSLSSFKDIKLGNIYYQGKSKLEVISKVYADDKRFDLWFDAINTFSINGKTFSNTTSIALSDYNITNGGYSPWMIFTEKEVAEAHYNENWVSHTEYDIDGELRDSFKCPDNTETISLKYIKKNLKIRPTFNQLLFLEKAE